ncbi:MAG: cytochrome c oxidase subunit [Nocardioidaceae bacterium]|nr:cytochrome c oxidase subunit [Nocardioidaceae bacterium]
MGLQLLKRVRKFGLLAILVPAVALLSSCSEQTKGEWKRIALPLGASDKSPAATEFWQWTWVAAMVVGVLVWGLIFFVLFHYRRRSDDEVPIQTRYNLPMEILYTIAPVIVVVVFFKFVVDVQTDENKQVSHPDHVVKVVGEQWSWTFNYYNDPALGGSTSVFEAGTPAELPTLYLPIGESVKFELSSPDVIHDFWVPAFTYKMDVVPGRNNSWSMTPTREGTFDGKCAELCGTYHSRMLFNVKVVSHDEFVAQLKKLQAEGNVGLALGGAEAHIQDGLKSNKKVVTQ